MAGVLRYKFKSEISYTNLLFDGQFISVGDLKRQVAEKRGYQSTELSIQKADSRDTYGDDGTLIPRNAQVLITRVPLGPQTKKHIVESRQEKEAERVAQNSRMTAHPGSKQHQDSSFLQPNATAPGQDEAAALSNFVDASYSNWSSEVNAGAGGRFGAGRRKFHSDLPPPNYVCHRCGVGGHWIYNCPTNGNPEYDVKKVKVPVGIPLEKLVSTGEGTIVMPDGTIGDVMVDDRAMAKEATTSFVRPKPAELEVPDDMKCPICGNLMNEAALIMCCQSSFCDNCIRTHLIETGTCPKCGKEDMLCDDVVPNQTMRKEIQKFKLDSLRPTAGLAIEGPKAEGQGLASPASPAGQLPSPGVAPEGQQVASPEAITPAAPAFAASPPATETAPAEQKQRFKVSAFRIPSRDGGAKGGDSSGGKLVDLMKGMNKILSNGPHSFFLEAFCETRGRPLSRRDFQDLQEDFSRRRKRRR